MNINEKSNRKKSQEALVSLGLEGIYPSPELLADLELLDTGKISEEEFVNRALSVTKNQNNLSQTK